MENVLDNRIRFSLPVIFGLGIGYVILHIFLKSSHLALAGVLEFIAVNGLIALVAIYFYILIGKTTSGSLARKIFLLFALSYTFSFFESSIYLTTYNILNIPRAQLSLAWLSSYNILYLVFLFFSVAAWVAILSVSMVEQKKSYGSYIPVFFILLATLIIYIFATKWGSIPYSIMAFYDFLDKVLTVSLLVLATLCLATSVNRGVKFLAIGTLINAASNTIMDFGLFSQGFGLNSFIESGRVFGELFMLYGLFMLIKHADVDDAKKWLAPANSIRAQAAYWSFIISMSAIVVFFVAAYFLKPTLFFK